MNAVTSATQTPTTSGVRRALIVLGLGLQPVTILAELVAAAFSRAPYSFADNTISDLGASTCTDIPYPRGPVPVCSQAHDLINGGFILSGVLLFIGVLAARPFVPRGAARGVGTGLFAIAALSTVATGLVPLDVDLEFHYLVSLPTFVAQPVAILAWAAALRRGPARRRGLVRSGLLAGVVCLVATVAFLLLEDMAHGAGALERLALWPALLWFPALGWVLPRPGHLLPRRDT